ncbi:hypothetical protein BGZ65_007255 [Modicella reniformis]|uniref:Uncharacterized protein n=1 Tax=Modicella reniformis TaxID=1440133 RepID=A0A9P6ML83_9FUNG|nr:hypothetical protein BGZ65_007255 [Modicella reniformis]
MTYQACPRTELRSTIATRTEQVFPDVYSDRPYSKLVYPAVSEDPDSPPDYIAYNHQGHRIIDFSMVGWNEGNTDLPAPLRDVLVMERLWSRPEADSNSDKGDDTDRIQGALASENLLGGKWVIQWGVKPFAHFIRRHYGGGYVTTFRDGKVKALGIQFLDMAFPRNIGRTTDDMLDDKGRGSKDYRFSYEVFANYVL